MPDHAHPEIVIIRRGGHDDHDDHHGGVWKIAFADFMTAMMAFFLVMWLISANDKTRASVARYFNPVRLVDATTQPRGLHDAKKDESGVTASADTKEKAAADKARDTDAAKPGMPPQGETPAGRETRLENGLRDNPFVALAEIAATKGPGYIAAQHEMPLGAPVIGRRGGDAFRDPFAPQPTHADAETKDDTSDAPSVTKPPASKATPIANPQKAETAKIAAALKGLGPSVDVRRTGEGLLVSLTDNAEFSMFPNGSSVPSRRVVLMMERVAQTLKGRPGTIVVRGYTDNKMFRSRHYDNWRLSLDRAQVTHYMLVRGGLLDARIGHVEGYADRGGMTGVDPSSPVNRRIDILLKDAT